MSEYVVTRVEDSPTVLQVFPGGPVTVYTGASGQASNTVINPAIPGLSAGDVQSAIAEISNQITLAKPAAEIIGGHRVVYLAADGVRYASNDDISHLGLVLGITSGATVQNAQAFIKTTGEMIEPSWNWTSPGLIFLGQNGLLVQSSPGPPAVFSQVIGQAISSTKIFINIQSPIVFN